MEELTCIVCPNGCSLTIEKVDEKWEVTGNQCQRGKIFAINEMENPQRSVTSTVKTVYKSMPRVSVKTQGEIPKKDILTLMKLLDDVVVDRVMSCGDIILENVLGSGVNVVCTSDMNLWIKGA